MGLSQAYSDRPDCESMSVSFDNSINPELHGAIVTDNGGFFTYRHLNHTLGLLDSVSVSFIDKNSGNNIQHDG